MSTLADVPTVPAPDLHRSLAATDPEVAAAIADELRRQQTTLEMIASENFAPLAVMQAQGSVLTNKYAEGYPGRRYYGGCEHVDVIETARDRAAQGAVRRRVRERAAALGRPGQRGGDGRPAGARRHHPRPRPGARRPPDARDAAQLLRQALRRRRLPRRPRTTTASTWPRSSGWPDERRPKLIIAGWSAYPRQLDFAEFRRIADEVGAYLMVDMAHFAGLVAAGLHPSPGAARPRGHLHHAQDPRRPARRRHPDHRGAGQEVQLVGVPRPAGRAARARHRRQGRGLQARRRARVPRAAGAHPRRRRGSSPTACWPTTVARPASTWSAAAPTSTWCWSTCANPSSTASRPRTACTRVGITVNRNAVPFDPRPPMVSSGVRIGTPALATRGFDADDFAEVADVIALALRPDARRRGASPACVRGSTRLAEPSPALPGPLETALMTPAHARRRPAGPPRLPLAQPGAEEVLRRRHRRRRRPRPGHRALPGEEPRHHQRRGAGEGLAGRRQHGPQHHADPVQLPVGRERRASTSTRSSSGRASRRTSATRSCSASAGC